MRRTSPTHQVFAILRDDLPPTPDRSLEDRVTIKEVVWDLASAMAEVERLNRLNAGKAHYWWQATRLSAVPGPRKE